MKRLANSVIRDGILFVGLLVVAVMVVLTFYAIAYFWHVTDADKPGNCRVFDLGRQRVLIEDVPHFANVSTYYCNPTPEGAQ